MQSTFDLCVDFTLQLEGGAVVDRDGLTVMGITQRDHPDLFKAGTPKKAQAIERYRSDYWTPAGCDHVSPPIAAVLFDWSVQSGVEEPVMALQLLAYARPIDGSNGPKTRLRSRKYPALALADALITVRGERLRLLGEQDVFHRDRQRGYRNRLDALRTFIRRFSPAGG